MIMGGDDPDVRVEDTHAPSLADENFRTLSGIVALILTPACDLLDSKIKAGTNGLTVTGDVTVNGEIMSRAFFLENAAYVPQEDRLWSALTGT